MNFLRIFLRREKSSKTIAEYRNEDRVVHCQTPISEQPKRVSTVGCLVEVQSNVRSQLDPNCFTMSLLPNATVLCLSQPNPGIDPVTWDRLSQSYDLVALKSQSESDIDLIGTYVPGHVIVIESDDDASTSVYALSSVIARVRHDGNMPTIVVLGNRLPSDAIVGWMRYSIFAYAELDSSLDKIVRLIEEAVEYGASVQQRFERYRFLNDHQRSLTVAEHSVLDMVLGGIPNKTIASKLQVSQRTIEARRQKLYQKMGCKSLPGVIQSICEWKQLQLEFGGLTAQSASFGKS